MKKRLLAALLVVLTIASMLTACGGNEKEQIIIYSCANDKRIAFMQEKLAEKFPEYDCIVEYQSTSKLAAKLLAEGTATDCDIVHDLLYLNLDALEKEGILADVSGFDTSMYVADTLLSDKYIIEAKTSGAIIFNNDVMDRLGLPYPESYQDLLKPEYKGLISMPDPKASGTGYVFYKSLVNAWGEEEALKYFEALSENILQFTSSGNGPVKALKQEEVAIGLGMAVNAADLIDEGLNLSIVFFEEGAPFTMYGQTIIEGKDERECVNEVFTYLIGEFAIEETEVVSKEKIFNDYDFISGSFPVIEKYSDMSNDTLTEKERLLELWTLS